MTKHVYKCKLLEKFTYSFKHLVFLQLQRLQPSTSTVLEVFFLKNHTQFSCQLSNYIIEIQYQTIKKENANSLFLFGTRLVVLLITVSLFRVIFPLIIWSCIMLYRLQQIQRICSVGKLRRSRTCSY